MAVDRQLTPGLREDCLRSADVVEVGVHYGHHWHLSPSAELSQRRGHLLIALAGVDGDDALRALDERLVRQTVAHQGPDPRRDIVECAHHPRRLLKGAAVDLLSVDVFDRH